MYRFFRVEGHEHPIGINADEPAPMLELLPDHTIRVVDTAAEFENGSRHQATRDLSIFTINISGETFAVLDGCPVHGYVLALEAGLRWDMLELGRYNTAGGWRRMAAAAAIIAWQAALLRRNEEGLAGIPTSGAIN